MSSSTSVRQDNGTGSTRVGAQEQEGVAVVVLVVVGRGVVAADPHGKANEDMTLNFAPRRPLGMPARAPATLVAAAPPSLNGA